MSDPFDQDSYYHIRHLIDRLLGLEPSSSPYSKEGVPAPPGWSGALLGERLRCDPAASPLQLTIDGKRVLGEEFDGRPTKKQAQEQELREVLEWLEKNGLAPHLVEALKEYGMVTWGDVRHMAAWARDEPRSPRDVIPEDAPDADRDAMWAALKAPLPARAAAPPPWDLRHWTIPTLLSSLPHGLLASGLTGPLVSAVAALCARHGVPAVSVGSGAGALERLLALLFPVEVLAVAPAPRGSSGEPLEDSSGPPLDCDAAKVHELFGDRTIGTAAPPRNRALKRCAKTVAKLLERRPDVKGATVLLLVRPWPDSYYKEGETPYDIGAIKDLLPLAVVAAGDDSTDFSSRFDDWAGEGGHPGYTLLHESPVQMLRGGLGQWLYDAGWPYFRPIPEIFPWAQYLKYRVFVRDAPEEPAGGGGGSARG